LSLAGLVCGCAAENHHAELQGNQTVQGQTMKASAKYDEEELEILQAWEA
jgi:hypothetical protein